MVCFQRLSNNVHLKWVQMKSGASHSKQKNGVTATRLLPVICGTALILISFGVGGRAWSGTPASSLFPTNAISAVGYQNSQTGPQPPIWVSATSSRPQTAKWFPNSSSTLGIVPSQDFNSAIVTFEPSPDAALINLNHVGTLAWLDNTLPAPSQFTVSTDNRWVADSTSSSSSSSITQIYSLSKFRATPNTITFPIRMTSPNYGNKPQFLSPDILGFGLNDRLLVVIAGDLWSTSTLGSDAKLIYGPGLIPTSTFSIDSGLLDTTSNLSQNGVVALLNEQYHPNGISTFSTKIISPQGKLLHTFSNLQPRQFSPDGKYLVTYSYSPSSVSSLDYRVCSMVNFVCRQPPNNGWVENWLPNGELPIAALSANTPAPDGISLRWWNPSTNVVLNAPISFSRADFSYINDVWPTQLIRQALATRFPTAATSAQPCNPSSLVSALSSNGDTHLILTKYYCKYGYAVGWVSSDSDPGSGAQVIWKLISSNWKVIFLDSATPVAAAIGMPANIMTELFQNLYKHGINTSIHT